LQFLSNKLEASSPCGWLLSRCELSRLRALTLHTEKNRCANYKDQGYEVAGFVWWQGHKDQNAGHASRYEFNLVIGEGQSFALPAWREHIRLRTPELGNDAAPIGSAELAFEHLLVDPLLM